MRRGFKAETNALAREVRDALSIAHSAPLDMRLLAEYLDIPVVMLSDWKEAAPTAAELFLNDREALFSGVTVFRGPHRTILINDAHSLGRQASDLAHELAHALLQHSPSPALDENGCRIWDREVEDEADWQGGALLIPEEAALSIVRRRLSLPEAAAEYGVSQRMIQFRLNVTGARRRVRRGRSKHAVIRRR